MNELKIPFFVEVIVTPLTQTRLCIENEKSFDSALIKINSILAKLADPKLKTFPKYSEVLEKLEIITELQNLKNMLANSSSNSNLTMILEKFKTLEKRSHMLSFYEKVNNNTLLFLEKKGDECTSHCKGHFIWSKPVGDAYFSEPMIEKVNNLLDHFDKKQLQIMSEYCFNNMSKPSPMNVYAFLDLSKDNIFDERYKLLKNCVFFGNVYKQQLNLINESINANTAEPPEQPVMAMR